MREQGLFRVRLVQEHADVVDRALVEVLDSLDYLRNSGGEMGEIKEIIGLNWFSNSYSIHKIHSDNFYIYFHKIYKTQ